MYRSSFHGDHPVLQQAHDVFPVPDEKDTLCISADHWHKQLQFYSYRTELAGQPGLMNS